MNEPLPSPIDVNLHSGPAEWWQLLAGLAPVAALVAAAIAGWIAWKSLRQKTAADNRGEWWRRAQWAVDSILSDEPRRAKVGLQVMTVLAESTPSAEELKIFSGTARDLVDAREALSARHETSHPATDKVQPDDCSDKRSVNANVDQANSPR